MLNSLWFDKDLKNATETARIHHQLTPNQVFAEKAVLQVRLSVCLSVCLSICRSVYSLVFLTR